MKTSKTYDVLIVGGGPAGLGIAIALQTLGLNNFAILERHEIGASFCRWPEQMRLITPSFNAHAFGYPDLNAITPRTAPSYTLGMEHPNGKSYATYLQIVYDHFSLPVTTGEDVSAVIPENNGTFRVTTARGEWKARFVIWAAGEFQYPRTPAFPGSELCQHSGSLRLLPDVEGRRAVIIGGYESGIDAAINMVRSGKQVQVIERTGFRSGDGQDPSTSLSPFTVERMRETLTAENFALATGVEARAVTRSGGYYVVHATGDERFVSDSPPILATGFESSARLIGSRFAWRPDGLPELNDMDESTLTPGLFLAGPSVRQGSIIFCFIYKFRQRFPVVARAIGERLGLDVSPLEKYRAGNMYLDDLSCCGEACSC